MLTEAPDADQAEYLRRLTEQPVVLGGRRGNASPLFWFTTSEFFTKLLDIDEAQQPEGTRKLPRWLADPASIAPPIWFTPVDDEPQRLLGPRTVPGPHQTLGTRSWDQETNFCPYVFLCCPPCTVAQVVWYDPIWL